MNKHLLDLIQKWLDTKTNSACSEAEERAYHKCARELLAIGRLIQADEAKAKKIMKNTVDELQRLL